MKFKTLLKTDSVEVTQSEKGTISFGYSNHSDAMFDLYLRITELEESLAKCKHQARFSIGEPNGYKDIVDVLDAAGVNCDWC